MSELTDLVALRLDEDDSLDEGVVSAVHDALTQVAPSSDGDHASQSGTSPAAEPGQAPDRVYLSALRVRAFRGIGNEAELPLTPGPGLTVVSGRNGSGKSSFAEGLEVALTGTTYRWLQRAAQWQKQWRNLHCEASPRIAVDVVAEGGQAAGILAEWNDPDDVKTLRTSLSGAVPVDSTPWTNALETYRPLLSYEELGQVLAASPTQLFDKLSAVLGLERIDDAVKVLATRRKELQDHAKRVKENRAELAGQLRRAAGASDPRIAQARDLLDVRTIDVASLRSLATGTADSATGTADTLRRLASLDFDRNAAERAAGDLHNTIRASLAVTDSATDSLQHRIAVIQAALAVHEHDGDMTCPVCATGTLDAGRARVLRSEVDSATTALQEVRAAAVRLERARAAARSMVTSAPRALTDPGEPAVEAERQAAFDIWLEWASTPDDDVTLARHLESVAPRLDDALSRLRDRAAGALAARDDSWAPLAAQLAVFADLADVAQRAKPELDRVTAAHAWLKANAEELKNERLTPIREQAARIWEQLRQESNVEIAGLRLTGSASQRRVVIESAVDGAPSNSGLAVLSQGELHALSLAMFLPRATMDASPFRFVVLDDPVQAMDPAKVDGLVDVLADIARTRQVIVFSHDDRLAAAVRRSSVQATVLEVTRGPSSSVMVVRNHTPARRYMQDAVAFTKDRRLPETTLRTLLPAMLRMALEAAAREVYFHRELNAGVRHTDIEDRWDSMRETRRRVGLAIGADATDWAGQPGRGYRRKALAISGRAVHQGLEGDARDAIDAVNRTAADILGGTQ
ncbi:AAA family ATPase [Myceligenerans crystallogenes]|uniref:Nuclease SbcCD subunit C n=1 Tax=Myceligenerans crystallogenes TaxID=316335 RepID=A0ABN2NLF2_9MICO